MLWGLIWQVFGAAISLPLYFAAHLDWLDKTSAQPQAVSGASAQAVPFSFALGAIIPAISGMLPTWIEPSARSPGKQQNFLAVWQPDPLWVSLIQQLIVAVLSRYAHYDGRKSYRWVQNSFLLSAFFSAIGHLYVNIAMLTSGDCIHRFTRMYLPFSSKGSPSTTNILIRGPWLFLQFDFIIISLSSLSWVCMLLCRLPLGEGPTRSTLVTYLLLGTVTIGPGATVSLALLWREGKLQRFQGIKKTSISEKH